MYVAGTEGSGSAPGVYLRDDPVFGSQLMNQSELRAPTAERAAFLLDAALAARTTGKRSILIFFKLSSLDLLSDLKLRILDWEILFVVIKLIE